MGLRRLKMEIMLMASGVIVTTHVIGTGVSQKFIANITKTHVMFKINYRWKLIILTAVVGLEQFSLFFVHIFCFNQNFETCKKSNQIYFLKVGTFSPFLRLHFWIVAHGNKFFYIIYLLSLQLFFQSLWYVQKYLDICNFEDATFVSNDHLSVGLLIMENMPFCTIVYYLWITHRRQILFSMKRLSSFFIGHTMRQLSKTLIPIQ